MRSHYCRLNGLLLTILPLVNAITVDVNNIGSIKAAALTTAEGLLSLYNGTKSGEPIGLYDEPYAWWESGAVWSGLLDYQAYTADTQFSNVIQQALSFQVGPNDNYLPPNQTKTEGHDDQGMWALAAMTAAERSFPSPPNSPTWIDLAKNVFNDQVAVWDITSCGGGLRWQLFTFNKGYDYKNAASQATFFLLAARLAKYTNNSTYVDWAGKAYDWTSKVGLINNDFKVYDGVQTAENCSDVDRIEWSYNSAAFMYGSAVLYNHTNDSQWQKRTQSLASAMSVFYPSDHPGIMVEIPCESEETCDTDQHAFKGLASQWIGATIQVAPYTNNFFVPKLQASAKGAAQQCSGGKNGTTCGFHWTEEKWDGSSGVGQQLSAMNVLVANLVAKGVTPNTTSTNGTQSLGSSKASGSSSSAPSPTSSGSAKPNDAAYPIMPLRLVHGLCVAIAISPILL